MFAAIVAVTASYIFPVNMDLCERLGLDRDFYSVSVPLGATINMDGAAITITVMSLATASTLGIQVLMKKCGCI